MLNPPVSHKLLYLLSGDKPCTVNSTPLSNRASGPWFLLLPHITLLGENGYSRWPIQQLNVKNTFLFGPLSKEDQSHNMILLVYVDNIILTGSSQSHLHAFIDMLGAEFDVKDLGKLHYSLGIVVTYHSDSVHLNPTKYALDILKRSNMQDCKPIFTLMASKGNLSRTNGTALPEPTVYRQLFGVL
ncbi:PREDICTED: uncharacterized mitochondrial protein AtMg00810-like [Prunus mume]|uniref:Uncharacterized mitochondrial protein AtMg00810-like n=1 Tax=Prunus mume TaxID=102107 RepID=A0ABM1LQH9_PRUMU|nr:PREDICTED: uncharacterized mitochondrial protein AtMg00810-like [Prunus mume]